MGYSNIIIAMKDIVRLPILLLVLIFSCKKEIQHTLTVSKVNAYPVVVVHGYLGSSDSYEYLSKMLETNGVAKEDIFYFDWNTTETNADLNAYQLEIFVDKVLAETGASKVDLIGHSLGGGLSYSYCKKEKNAPKVAHLAMIAPFLRYRTQLPNEGIPTLNIWPTLDYVVTDGAPIPNAINIELPDVDHNEIVATYKTFEPIFQLFYGKLPEMNMPKTVDNPEISGKVLTFVENKILEGSTLKIYEVASATGKRILPTPDAIFNIKKDGKWGPFFPRKEAYYEFEVSTPESGDRKLHFYRWPFASDNHALVFRTFPPEGSPLRFAFAGIPKDDAEAVAVFYSTSKALWLGRDNLTIDGASLTNETFLAPEKNTLAIFLYDDNKNNTTDLNSIPLFDGFQSLKGADFYMSALENGSTAFELNGVVLNTPKWPSKTDGISVAVF